MTKFYVEICSNQRFKIIQLSISLLQGTQLILYSFTLHLVARKTSASECSHICSFLLWWIHCDPQFQPPSPLLSQTITLTRWLTFSSKPVYKVRKKQSRTGTYITNAMSIYPPSKINWLLSDILVSLHNCPILQLYKYSDVVQLKNDFNYFYVCLDNRFCHCTLVLVSTYKGLNIEQSSPHVTVCHHTILWLAHTHKGSSMQVCIVSTSRIFQGKYIWLIWKKSPS